MLEKQIDLSSTAPPALPPTACASGEASHCLTCADALETARVIRVDAITGLALVERGPDTLEIDVSLLESVAPGEVVLVHGGVALGRAEEY